MIDTVVIILLLVICIVVIGIYRQLSKILEFLQSAKLQYRTLFDVSEENQKEMHKETSACLNFLCDAVEQKAERNIGA